MTNTPDREFLPVELVFNPNWWHQTAGISFERDFYFDAATRVQNDVTMRRVLHERFGDLGLGAVDPQPRPIVGSPYVAGGFIIPALLGADIIFAADAAPQPEPLDLTMDQIEALEKPDFLTLWPLTELIASMDALEAEYGYLVGDMNTDGLLNAAYHLYGQNLFLDFYENPARVNRVLELVGELIVDVALYMRERTGSCSIAVNRMVERVDPGLFLHANCSVQMISPQSYREIQLPVEQRMAARTQPYGVHHCGDNMHLIAPVYAELPASFFDVGWGSDVAACREALPDAFLNLRLNPVRMLQCSAEEIAQDTERLLQAAASAGSLDKVDPLSAVGVCCINMDQGTPDENIRAMFAVIQRYRAVGG
ncbi:uroporphyrinogen decarboxylase family protein [Chloroflexota bacterium]